MSDSIAHACNAQVQDFTAIDSNGLERLRDAADTAERAMHAADEQGDSICHYDYLKCHACGMRRGAWVDVCECGSSAADFLYDRRNPYGRAADAAAEYFGTLRDRFLKKHRQITSAIRKMTVDELRALLPIAQANADQAKAEIKAVRAASQVHSKTSEAEAAEERASYVVERIQLFLDVKEREAKLKAVRSWWKRRLRHYQSKNITPWLTVGQYNAMISLGYDPYSERMPKRRLANRRRSPRLSMYQTPRGRR